MPDAVWQPRRAAFRHERHQIDSRHVWHALMRVRTLMPARLLPFVLHISMLLSGCRAAAADRLSPILLFNGAGTSASDVSAVEAVLKQGRLEYSTVNSRQLNAMSESQLKAHRLLIVSSLWASGGQS